MFSLLLFGFLLGMRHTLEADHLAAVASLTSSTHSKFHALKLGAVWGVGHTITLFIFGSMALLFDQVISTQLASTLEFVVGIMLCGLGVDVLYRFKKNRIHFHSHQHEDESTHFHAHSHKGHTHHNEAAHQHKHDQGFPKRALLVGTIHGLAGSAALIVLTLQTVEKITTGLWYIALFGIGSIIGMATLSLIVAVPLRHSAKGLTGLHNSLQLGIGLMTIIVGINIAFKNFPA